MSKKQITKGQVGNALTSTAADHILGVADDIFDEEQQKYQSEINRQLQEDVLPQMLTVVARESSTSIRDPLDLLLPLPPIDPEEPETDTPDTPDVPDTPEPPVLEKLVWGVSKWGQSTW